jgi:hypothetical protein
MDDDAAAKLFDSEHYFNGRSTYLDRQGNPMTLRAWAQARSNVDYRLVAHTQITDTCEVLTMWMGMDEDPLDDGPPNIFGSIIKSNGRFEGEVTTPNERGCTGSS